MADSVSLHITNSDAVVEALRVAVEGELLPWRDVLYEGPVPCGLDLPMLSRRRAAAIAAAFGGSPAAVERDFAARDAQLARFREYERVVLWFEHDLYDALQRLQLLAWFSEQDLRGTSLYEIVIDRFPGVEPFYGLGQLTGAQLASLVGREAPLEPSGLALAQRGWEAFRASDPSALEGFVAQAASGLAFVEPALRRWLEEYPAVGSGLPRSERQVLALLEARPRDPVSLFRAHQGIEEVPFLGDWSFWRRVQELAEGEAPLVHATPGPFRAPPRAPVDDAFRAQQLALTELGRSVLAGERDWLALRHFDRWLGGVHLAPGLASWRWDPAARALVRVGS